MLQSQLINKRLLVWAMSLSVLFLQACTNSSSVSLSARPREIIFTPTDAPAPTEESALDRQVARHPRHYSTEHEPDRGYIVRTENKVKQRVSGEWSGGTAMSLVEIATADGTHTYFHVAQYSHGLLSYGNLTNSALYEVDGLDTKEITKTAKMGFLQVQARMLMPGAYIGRQGDLYVIDSHQMIKVIRDGQVVATGDPSKLPTHEEGGTPRFLFIASTESGAPMLCILKPRPNGIAHKPLEDDIDAKFMIEIP